MASKSAKNQAVSRRGKKTEARAAVLSALGKRPPSYFADHRDYDIVVDHLVGLIKRHKLAKVSIDYVDVGQALRYLHHSGAITVSHGKDADFAHKIILNQR